jgi:hypothetical protein
MKHLITLQFFFLCLFSYAQNFQINKIVADKDTKSPLENVTIFNESDISATNAEGKFAFISQKNEINLNLLGYNTIKTTFDNLKNSKDTIFMEMKATQLQEVVVSSIDPFMKKVFEKAKDNFLQNYTANFFLRNILKKDKTNIVLQDIYARTNKNTDPKKTRNIEILNMRKISLIDKKDHAKFKFPDFNKFYDMPILHFGNCIFTEIPFNDSNFKKILFETNTKNAWGQTWKGYFIINRDDYAIIEYSITQIDNPDIIPYNKPSSPHYRTIKSDKFIKFTKDAASHKYYASISRLEAQVELVRDEKTEKKICYDLDINYFVTNSPTNEKINSNFAADKDIFKAKFPYSKEFWSSQNQLPLTNELQLFLKSVDEKKEKTKEFEVIGNF